MAKRYYESKSERSMMKKAGEMINEDRNAPALLPQYVIEKDYGYAGGMEHGYMDDLYMGVSKQMQEDRIDFKKVLKPSKY